MADTKISDLTEIDAIVDADLVPMVDDVAGTPTTKKSRSGNRFTSCGNARMTVSIPLFGLSRPNVSRSRLPTAPRRSLCCAASSRDRSGMPCGIITTLSAGTS